MAYIYFKLKEYDYALQYFKNFNLDNVHLILLQEILI